MSTITSLATADSGATSRTTINTNFTNLNTDKLEKAAGATTGNIPTFGSSNVLQDSGKTAPGGDIVGTTDIQTLTNKTVDGATPAEIGYLSGVTSSIQTQLNGKAATSHTHAASDIASGTVATARLGSGTADSTTFLRGDQSWAVPTASTKITTVLSDVSISSSTTESTLISTSIPGGTLGTSGAVKARLLISAFGLTYSNQTCTIRLKYGATTVATLTLTNSSTTTITGLSGVVDVLLLANGATNSQEGSVYASLGNGTITSASIDNYFLIRAAAGTAAENSTTALNLVVTAQFSNNSANDNLTMSHAVVEKVV